MASNKHTARFGTATGARWIPDPEAQRASVLWQVMAAMSVPDAAALHERAVADPELYWRTVTGLLDIRFDRPFRSVLDTSDGLPFPRWFVGGTLNLVQTCVRSKVADGRGDVDAVVTWDEQGGRAALTYAELERDAAHLAAHLYDRGVRKGDCVGLFLPMTPHATVAFFACAWLGAVAIPAFSGYGPDALSTRLRDCGAKALLTADGFQRKGRHVAMADIAATAVADVPTIENLVCVGEPPAHTSGGATWVSWDDALDAGAASVHREPEPTDPNDPVMVIYTSGTTGRPKGIVHSHAGFVVKAASDFGVAFDLKPEDRLFWITDLGWLMGPLLMVANGARGSTAVYYVGAPDHPDIGQVWRVCERERVTMLGISPTAVRGMAAAGGASPAATFDLNALRVLLSTGEPWDPAAWSWLFEQVGRERLPIVNYTGGTEIGGGILTCYTALPLKECAFTGPVIGLDADVLGPDAAPVTGATGELAVRNVWPGMTHAFWHDPQRYLDTYWSEFENIWMHGDLAVHDDDGYWYVTGRSDDTMKIAGRRVGPGEVEDVLLQHPSVAQAAAVGIPDAVKGQVIAAFLVPAPGRDVDPADITGHVAERLGRSLVPARIEVVDALPRTRSGKLLRRVIRARYTGTDPGDLSSLDDPGVVDRLPVSAAPVAG